jgi:hypothetical protein
MKAIEISYLRQDKLLEIVVKSHRKHVMGTYVDDLVMLIRVVFEEDVLDVSPLNQLNEIYEIFNIQCLDYIPNRA